MRLLRLLRILTVVWRYRLDEIVVASLKNPTLVRLVRWTTFGAQRDPRAVRLRRALEDLGPIFVKFGQLLSTRRDLLPTDLWRGGRSSAASRARSMRCSPRSKTRR